MKSCQVWKRKRECRYYVETGIIPSSPRRTNARTPVRTTAQSEKNPSWGALTRLIPPNLPSSSGGLREKRYTPSPCVIEFVFGSLSRRISLCKDGAWMTLAEYWYRRRLLLVVVVVVGVNGGLRSTMLTQSDLIDEHGNFEAKVPPAA